MRKFILNADGFGMSKAFNRAVLDGYHNGFLTSASLCPNGKAFNAAVNEIIPECPNLGIGIQVNLSTGRSLTKAPLLTNKKGKFNNNFLKLLLKSKNKKFLQQVEFEFKTQIETVMNYTKVDHIDSRLNIHGIPEIFKILAKLAKEYNIPYIRTHHEEFYFVPNFKKHVNFSYTLNLTKLLLLNYFSIENKKFATELNLRTNDHIIGIAYANLMDASTIECGLKELEENGLVEGVINPCHYSTSSRNKHQNEFLITQDKSLKDKIDRLGFAVTNYKKENSSIHE